MASAPGRTTATGFSLRLTIQGAVGQPAHRRGQPCGLAGAYAPRPPPTQALIPPTGLRLDDEPRRAGEPTLPHSGSPLPSRVVWQLFTLMIISKGSGYGLSSHLLRAVMLYLNTQ